eukprot:TRINITY_DN193_c0_g1_i1.p1 TRINITY_DN193_c0_g1~~TRINITY_DN193_c0_g1_i1.p1  ORF type:complete len:288 (-),score=82.55 TRINITY_DN193_c0_g1_i1:157-1020(-)
MKKAASKSQKKDQGKLVITEPKGLAKKKPTKPVKKGVKKSWRVGFPLYEKKQKNFGIGQSIQPKRDLTRFVKWPQYIRVQRQKRVLLQRLKVPPTVHQFRQVFSKNHAVATYKFLAKYRPEEPQKRRARLLKLAAAKAKGETLKDNALKRPISLVAGIKSVTEAIERKKAQLVVIAHDVDPIEVVIWLPTLCRKMDVPYVIVRGKSRLGQLVHRKTCAVVAITDIRKDDKTALGNIVQAAREKFTDNAERRRQWGGQKLGPKARAKLERQKKLIAKETKLREKAANK